MSDNLRKEMTLADLQAKVNETYLKAFGRTPLRQRLEDIQGEVTELVRFTDLPNLREETFDAISSLIQFCNENRWDIAEGLEENRCKILGRMEQYRSYGRKIKVAIFGGGFDPITKGHIKVAKLVLNYSREFDEVWLMPCYRHMYNKSMADQEHRLAMCRLAAECDARIQVSGYEIENKLGGETYHMVKRLKEEDYSKHQYDFSLLIGLDNAMTFEKWLNYEHLEREIRFITVLRKGTQIDESIQWYRRQPHLYLMPQKDDDLMQISSTDVRSMIMDKDPAVENYLDPLVLQYIHDNQLYGYKANMPKGL